jgi:hypothetical protein
VQNGLSLKCNIIGAVVTYYFSLSLSGLTSEIDDDDGGDDFCPNPPKRAGRRRHRRRHDTVPKKSLTPKMRARSLPCSIFFFFHLSLYLAAVLVLYHRDRASPPPTNQPQP